MSDSLKRNLTMSRIKETILHFMCQYLEFSQSKGHNTTVELDKEESELLSEEDQQILQAWAARYKCDLYIEQHELGRFYYTLTEWEINNG